MKIYELQIYRDGQPDYGFMLKSKVKNTALLYWKKYDRLCTEGKWSADDQSTSKSS